MPLYSASKHALTGVVRSLGPQLAVENITVNAVCPNVTRKMLQFYKPPAWSSTH